jgi:Protein of unknown function (DUF3574)
MTIRGCRSGFHSSMTPMLKPCLSILLVMTCWFAAGCNARSTDGTATWQRSELYFGLSRRDAPDVSEAEWKDFVTNQVTPAFPGGFTELIAFGHFREDGSNKSEPVRVLVVLNPIDQADSVGRKLDTLGKAYCARFGQDAVLRADSHTNLTFLREK